MATIKAYLILPSSVPEKLCKWSFYSQTLLLDMPGGHVCRYPGVSPERHELWSSSTPRPRLHGARPWRHVRSVCCDEHAVTLSALLRGSPEVRRTVAGMLGWNPAHSWPDSVTKHQKSSESVFQSKKISVNMCVFFKKCWSMMGRSFYPLLTDLLKTRKCLNWAPLDLTIK